MLKSILVPVDGSAESMRAVPFALALARRDGASVELVHVFQRDIYESGTPVLDRRFDAEIRQSFREKLEQEAARLGREFGVPVSATFLEGTVLPTLRETIATRVPDLVVMTTHGRGGLARVWFGSVADRLVREVPGSFLLVRPDQEPSASEAPFFRRVLITLDGSDTSEEILAHRDALGAAGHVDYVLATIVEPPAPDTLFLDIAPAPQMAEGQREMDEILRQRVERATDYLEQIAAGLRGKGDTATTHVTVSGNPARAILGLVDTEHVDAIALTTHGQGGIARAVLGSVADKVVRAAPVPVLLYRPQQTAAQSTAKERPAAAKRPAGRVTAAR